MAKGHTAVKRQKDWGPVQLFPDGRAGAGAGAKALHCEGPGVLAPQAVWSRPEDLRALFSSCSEIWLQPRGRLGDVLNTSRSKYCLPSCSQRKDSRDKGRGPSYERLSPTQRQWGLQMSPCSVW